MKKYYVYITANRKNGTLSTGVTSDLVKKMWQQKSEFAKKSIRAADGCSLVYYEGKADVYEAIQREKIIQTLSTNSKFNLIEKRNPDWLDLYDEVAWPKPLHSRQKMDVVEMDVA